VIFLETGMRISETLQINMDQFDDKHFRKVRRKGKRPDDVYVSPEARAGLKECFDQERGRGAGSLFQSRNGRPTLKKRRQPILEANWSDGQSVFVQGGAIKPSRSLDWTQAVEAG
jgi:integrase